MTRSVSKRGIGVLLTVSSMTVAWMLAAPHTLAQVGWLMFGVMAVLGLGGLVGRNDLAEPTIFDVIGAVESEAAVPTTASISLCKGRKL